MEVEISKFPKALALSTEEIFSSSLAHKLAQGLFTKGYHGFLAMILPKRGSLTFYVRFPDFVVD